MSDREMAVRLLEAREAEVLSLRGVLKAARRWFDPHDAYGNFRSHKDVAGDIDAAISAATSTEHLKDVLEKAWRCGYRAAPVYGENSPAEIAEDCAADIDALLGVRSSEAKP